MTPADFRTAIAALGYNQARFAERIGATDRQVRRWASGETPVPGRVALVLELEAERRAYKAPYAARGALDRAT